MPLHLPCSVNHCPGHMQPGMQLHAEGPAPVLKAVHKPPHSSPHTQHMTQHMTAVHAVVVMAVCSFMQLVLQHHRSTAALQAVQADLQGSAT